MLSMAATNASAQLPERPCTRQAIRDSIQIVSENPDAAFSDFDDEPAFKIYRLAVTDKLVRLLFNRFCSVGKPTPIFKISFIYRSLVSRTTKPLKPIVLSTQGKTMQTPWVKIAQNDQVFEAIYIFSERQVIYDQAKLANLELPFNDDLQPIPLMALLGSFSYYEENLTVKEQNLQDLLWLFKLADLESRNSRNFPRHDIILQASVNYAILANFLTDKFRYDRESVTYRDIMSLPKEFNLNSFRLNGVIWNSSRNYPFTPRRPKKTK
jgi:hypothetical protein